MHISSSMLHSGVCPVTAAVSAVGIGAAIYYAGKSESKPSVARFAGVTALVFAMQMLNYPIQNGTSGHLLGGVLAAGLLGIPFGVLAMAVVLTVQCIFFADGGLNALGANVLNMALIGTALSGFFLRKAETIKLNNPMKLAFVSWLSVMLAALVCSVEVAMAGTVSLWKVIPAMLSTHALVGIGEGAITAFVVYGIFSSRWIARMNEKMVAATAFVLAIVVALVSPFASSSPDGLEKVSQQLQFRSFPVDQIRALFADYQVPFVASQGLSTILAGVIGVGIVSLVSMAIARMTTGLSLRK